MDYETRIDDLFALDLTSVDFSLRLTCVDKSETRNYNGRGIFIAKRFHNYNSLAKLLLDRSD